MRWLLTFYKFMGRKNLCYEMLHSKNLDLLYTKKGKKLDMG